MPFIHKVLGEVAIVPIVIGTISYTQIKELASKLNKLSKNYQKLIDGGEDPGTAILRLFNFSDYVIEGPGKKTKVPAGGFNYDDIMYDNENTYDDNITY